MSTVTLKLTNGVLRTSGFAAQAIATTANHTGDVIDNAANLDPEMTLEALYQYATAPTAAKTVVVHLLKSVDGTNYEEVSSKNQIAAFSPAADTDAHRIVLASGRALQPFRFKLYVENTDTAQTITLTLNCYTHGQKAE